MRAPRSCSWRPRKWCDNSGSNMPLESTSHRQIPFFKTTMDFNHAGRIFQSWRLWHKQFTVRRRRPCEHKIALVRHKISSLRELNGKMHIGWPAYGRRARRRKTHHLNAHNTAALTLICRCWSENRDAVAPREACELSTNVHNMPMSVQNGASGCVIPTHTHTHTHTHRIMCEERERDRKVME